MSYFGFTLDNASKCSMLLSQNNVAIFDVVQSDVLRHKTCIRIVVDLKSNNNINNLTTYMYTVNFK